MSSGSLFPLNDEQRQILEAEVDSLLGLLPEELRLEFAALQEGIRRGILSVEQMPALERLLAWTLHTGRARREYSPTGERMLVDIYWRTPSGKETARQIDGLNAALRALKGRRLLGIHVSAQEVRVARVVLEAEGLTVSLSFEPPHVELESLSLA